VLSSAPRSGIPRGKALGSGTSGKEDWKIRNAK
jgi:hypothetical protein